MRFTSSYRGLILQDGPAKAGAPAPEPWARFVGGMFETDDDKIAARLRKVEYVDELPADEPDDQADEPDDQAGKPGATEAGKAGK